MAQRYAVQYKLDYWKKKGYEVVVGAKRLGPEGSNQLILVEKKEKVKKPLQKKEEVKNDGRGNEPTNGNVGRAGKSGSNYTGSKTGGGKGKSRR